VFSILLLIKIIKHLPLYICLASFDFRLFRNRSC